MTLVRAVGAAFDDPQGGTVGPFDLVLCQGQRREVAAETTRAASIAARLLGAIVKPTRGTVYIGDFDTRLQPPAAKRRLGFVDRAGFDGDDHAFACEAALRADVWGLDVRLAERRARDVLAALPDLDPAYGRALALALVPEIAFVVLDQPPAELAGTLRALVPDLAVLETHVARQAPLARVPAAL